MSIFTEAIEKAGLKPMVNLIKKTIYSNESVARTLARIRRDTGQSYIFDLSISPNYMNTSMNSIFVS
jgi:predicted metalloendopeptidase